MQASLDITHQLHEGEGNWFACRVQALAQHYQTFEELPVEKWVVTELCDRGCMMNQWRNRSGIGSPLSPLVKSHLSTFEKP